MKKLRNPYEVLGIKEGASQEEIKKAYREQVKKYHPDLHQSNPLYQLAEEKLREINEAYEYLSKNKGTSQRGGSRWGGRANNDGWNAQSTGGNETFTQVRMHIRSGNIGAAESLLDSISERTAEWHYLKGLVFLRKGWHDEAFSSIQTAANMDPSNFEYRDALNRMGRNNATYRGGAQGRGYNQGPDLCTMCQCLWCSDCCCECAGGDLIECC